VQQQLTFNPKHPEFACPPQKIAEGKIPSLQQVLEDAKQSKLHLKLELKGGHDLVESVLELVDSMEMVDQISFSSFNMEYLAMVRSLRPQKNPITGRHIYRTGALFNDVGNDDGNDDNYDHHHDAIIAQAKSVGACEIHLRYDTCTAQFIQKIHDHGFGSMAWFRGPVGMEHDCTHKYWDVGNEDEAMYEALLRTGVQQMCINRPDVLLELRGKLFSSAQQHPMESKSE
jgi:glycerophosphoryl diester phosphodiesterase